MCYNVNAEASMESVHHKWYPEIRKFCPGTPYILVGTQIDLVKDKAKLNEIVEIGQNLAKEIKAVTFIPCSADTGEGIKDVFNKVNFIIFLCYINSLKLKEFINTFFFLNLK